MPDDSWGIVGPDLGPNCSQRLSADDTSRQRDKRESDSRHLLVNNPALTEL